jgi:beta-xylosidase
MYKILAILFFLATHTLSAQINIADPFVLKHDNKYYLYGTDDKNANAGIPVLVSEDMISWSGPAGRAQGSLALAKGRSFGTKGFWAPFVIKYNNKFYMYYTANENIAVAVSDSPLGPFTQEQFRPMQDSVKQIDPHVFIDDDGRRYIYFVRLINGNRTFAAELSDDMRSVRESTIVEVINKTQDWENVSGSNWPVTEAPAMLKYQDKYYLFYTANDFRSPAYNVGYAVSDSPLGPFTKYSGNPLIQQTDSIKGTGHCEFVINGLNEFIMFYHAHASALEPTPRRTLFSRGKFITDKESSQPLFQLSKEKIFLKPQLR